MSIAVSAVIAPSRLLRATLACYALVQCAGAALLLAAPPGLVAAPRLLALACLLAAGAALRATAAPNTRRIDISGLGALRLTVQGYRGVPAAPVGPLALLPGSTLWPGLLLLRLGQAGGRRQVLVLLPDSVAGGSFRPLSVALRHIAARNK